MVQIEKPMKKSRRILSMAHIQSQLIINLATFFYTSFDDETDFKMSVKRNELESKKKNGEFNSIIIASARTFIHASRKYA